MKRILYAVLTVFAWALAAVLAGATLADILDADALLASKHIVGWILCSLAAVGFQYQASDRQSVLMYA